MDEHQGFPARGLLEAPHPVRLASVAVRVNEFNNLSLASPHSSQASNKGTLGAMARVRLTDFCSPLFSLFKDEHSRLIQLLVHTRFAPHVPQWTSQ